MLLTRSSKKTTRRRLVAGTVGAGTALTALMAVFVSPVSASEASANAPDDNGCPSGYVCLWTQT